MKVRSAIKAMCKDCYIVRRGKTRFVYCKTTPKHKQRQGFHTAAHEGGGAQQYCALCAPVRNVSKSLNFANLRIGGVSLSAGAGGVPAPVPVEGIRAAGGVFGAIGPALWRG